MELSKKFSHRNLDGIFGLTLLIYGKNMKKRVTKFNLGNSIIVNLTSDRFLQQVQKIELITESDLEFFMMLKGNNL